MASKQYKTETIKAYGEMAMEITMVKGLTEDAVKRLMTLRTALDQRITEIKQDIHQLQMGYDVHTALLNEHTGVLSEHTGVLSEHTRILNEHTGVLSEHTRILNEHTTRFDRLETLLTQILIRLPEKP